MDLKESNFCEMGVGLLKIAKCRRPYALYDFLIFFQKIRELELIDKQRTEEMEQSLKEQNDAP